MSDQLVDVSYWLILQISQKEPAVDLNKIYQGSIELDHLYQILTTKAQHYWWVHYDIELSAVSLNNAFFRALSFLHDRHVEYARLRSTKETIWVKELLHLN